MDDEKQSRTILELVGPKLFRADGAAMDPWDSLSLSFLLERGRWYDDTPIDPWQRKALQLLLNDRVPIDQEVPPPSA
ncbi:hypothetical protein J0H58_34340 [bacterium]|nr:hypothetical protein [bacterium]